MTNSIEDLQQTVLSGGQLDAHDAGRLVALSEDTPYELLHAANTIREHFKGNVVHLCSIVNARSGRCSEDCRFCSQSAHHATGAPEYALMDRDAIIEAARRCADSAADSFGIVTSGRGPGSAKDFDMLCDVAGQLAGANACASLGTLDADSAARLRAAGLRRYNHNLETAPSFFHNICTTHTYDDRLATVKAAKAAGLEVCCGGIFGLGESWEQRIELALELRGLDVDTVPVNFLNPIPGTALEHLSVLPAMEGLRILALYRFLLPTKDIKAAGGRERCLGGLQSWMFYAGANGTLIGNYLTTAGRPPDEDLKMIEALGLVPRSRAEAHQ